MMAGAVIGALRVALGLDSAQFVTNAKKAQQQAKAAGSGIAGAFGAATKAAGLLTAAMAAASSAAVIVGLRGTINAMDELSKAAQKVGTSTEELSKLRHAADLSGVSAESLQTGMNKLNRAIVGIAPGAKGAAGELARLGVTANTGTLPAMLKVADQFQRMPDGAQKSALAIQLFGKAGADMIPLLNGGAAAIQQAAEEAERFGLVVLPETARGAEIFNDNISRMGKLTDGLKNKISEGLIPTLAVMTTAFIEGASVGTVWVDFGKTVAGVLVTIAEVAGGVAVEIRNTVTAATAGVQALQALASGRGFGSAGQILSRADDAMTFRRKLAEARFDAMRADIANFAPGAANSPGAGASAGSAAGGALGLKQAELTWLERARAGYYDSPINLGPLQIISPEEMGKLDVAQQAIGQIATDIPRISQMDVFKVSAFETASRFAENLSASLSQAIVFGQSLGDALVNSFKAAAAELLTSGLMDILLGSRNATGQRSGGFLGSILGFANGTNSAPGGLAMVGERGRELVNLPRGSRVIPNPRTEELMGGRSTRVTVGIDPRNGNITAFVDGQIAAFAPAIAQAGASMAQGQMSQRVQRRIR